MNLACAQRIVDAMTGQVVVAQLTVAATWWRRFAGWQFRKSPERGAGLLLVPCRAVHTHWMRFPIDIAFFDRANEVVDMRFSVPPWRFVAASQQAHAVLETPAGGLAGRLRIGDFVRFEPTCE